MTIKDLAEMTVTFGLVCQKYVASFVSPRNTHPLSKVSLPLAKQSPHIFELTLLAARLSGITLYYFATFFQALLQMTIFFLPCTPVQVALIVPLILTIEQLILGAAPLSGI